MLRLFRVRAWCLATALFLATGTVSASLDVLLHTDTSHADACLPLSIAHDASAHRIQAAAPSLDGGSTHCVACHWARSLRLGPEAACPSERPDEPDTIQAAPTIGATRAPALTHLQPRSPPRFA